MTPAWATFEERVRNTAALIWDRSAGPDRIGGVNVDCVLKLDDGHYVLIEITEENSLNKVRDDVIKLVTARNALSMEKNAQATCICVVKAERITPSMVDAGKGQAVFVNSLSKFERQFFDFPSYNLARQRVQFGSAVNPVSGDKDDSEYVPVKYVAGSREVDLLEICTFLIKQRAVIMTGEYGSGKSRCVRELFNLLASQSAETGTYPIAIDLKENWGLKRASEIIRRHFEDLGLDSAAPNVLKGLAGPRFIFILDGFDEIGIQSWSDDQTKLRNTRNKSLEGVRDLISKHKGGVFVCGREHYFNNDDEMLTALGVKGRSLTMVKSKAEFTESEIAAYLKDIAEDYDLPAWVPRRPLICQIIVSLAEKDLEQMLGTDDGDVAF